jgi:glycosyltransferase involved in cell wall biosynthesis
MADERGESLNILHVMRAPVGGLFRHVADLARGQAARGHRVGVIADASTGGAQAEATLAALSRELALGLTRVPMSRDIGRGDLAAVQHVTRRAAEVGADVLHGHGAKGGAYARLAKAPALRRQLGKAIRVYTPHGGSLHYRWGSPVGLIYLTAERVLNSRTDLFLFESAYGRDAFVAKVGEPHGLVRVVHNGVTEAEFQPVVPDQDATDLLFIGELRKLKGVDVLITAIKELSRDGRRVSATIVGDGPDRVQFEDEVAKQSLTETVHFVGAKPARQAFALGRLLVVPSRAESLPYIVLEAAAVGIPMIATNVGGIPEIFGSDARALVPPGDAPDLARAIAQAMQDRGTRHSASLRLKGRVRSAFSADVMTEAIVAAYREALAGRNG